LAILARRRPPHERRRNETLQRSCELGPLPKTDTVKAEHRLSVNLKAKLDRYALCGELYGDPVVDTGTFIAAGSLQGEGSRVQTQLIMKGKHYA